MSGRGRDPRRVLIVVQNLPLPGDRRVWLEAQALRDAGHHVSAITPMAPGDPEYQGLDGVHLYKYPPPPDSSGVLSFIREFLYCWFATARLAVRVYREQGFAVLQACNPPDTYWALALIFRPLGVRFVFDQHDLSPEVYLSRFRRSGGLIYRILLWLEKATYRVADRVIATNESYRQVALTRGGCRDDHVTVVRTGPDSTRMVRRAAEPELRRGRSHMCCYIGVMGPQDGVDVLVEAIDRFVHELGRTDTLFALLGKGDAWEDVRRLVAQRGLEDHVYLPGRVTDEELFRYLSSSDVGLCPDPPSPLNDVSTMNKTMEYMSFELPVIAFDLVETKVSAGPAGVYVDGDDPTDFAKALQALLDDEPRRRELGSCGRRRVVDQLDWRHQAPAYVKVFDDLAGEPRPR